MAACISIPLSIGIDMVSTIRVARGSTVFMFGELMVN